MLLWSANSGVAGAAIMDRREEMGAGIGNADTENGWRGVLYWIPVISYLHIPFKIKTH